MNSTQREHLDRTIQQMNEAKTLLDLQRIAIQYLAEITSERLEQHGRWLRSCIGIHDGSVSIGDVGGMAQRDIADLAVRMTMLTNAGTRAELRIARQIAAQRGAGDVDLDSRGEESQIGNDPDVELHCGPPEHAGQLLVW